MNRELQFENLDKRIGNLRSCIQRLKDITARSGHCWKGESADLDRALWTQLEEELELFIREAGRRAGELYGNGGCAADTVQSRDRLPANPLE